MGIKKYFKKYLLKSADGHGGEEAYFKDHAEDNNSPNYDALIRIVPSPLSGWNGPTGPNGDTLGTLRDTGDYLVITLEDRKEPIKLDYWQAAILHNLLNIERLNQTFPADEIIEDEDWQPTEEVLKFYSEDNNES